MLSKPSSSSHEPRATSQQGGGPLRLASATDRKLPGASAVLRHCLDTASLLQGRTLEAQQHVPAELRERVHKVHRDASAIARELHAAIDDCPAHAAGKPITQTIDADGEPALTVAADLLDEVEYQVKRAQQGISAGGNDGDAAYLNGIIDRLQDLRSDIEDVQKPSSNTANTIPLGDTP